MTVYLSADDVIHLHDEALQEYGGTHGLRDAGALESAIAQPAMHAFGVEPYSTVPVKAAAYLHFIARNHAFVDGNKRTAYAATYTFLLMNHWELTGDDNQVFVLVLCTAQGQLGEPQQVALRLEKLITPLKYGR